MTDRDRENQNATLTDDQRAQQEADAMLARMNETQRGKTLAFMQGMLAASAA